MKIWIFVASFFIILITISIINFKVNGEFKIETSWLALSLTPVVIWLLTTHQLSEFSGFGLAFKLNKVTSTPVSLKLDGDKITPEQVSHDEKEGLGKIDRFIKNKVAAITLEVGRQGYYVNSAIKSYLRELTQYSFFKYVIFQNKKGEFQGIIPADEMLEKMQDRSVDLVQAIESGDISNIEGVSTVSVPSGSSKQKALQVIDEHGLSELPVIDESKSFIGVVERSKITSSIVAQLVSAQ